MELTPISRERRENVAGVVRLECNAKAVAHEEIIET
jgi:hypothetical protein